MSSLLHFPLAFFVLAAGAAAPAAGQSLVGSFSVSDGPIWTANPPTYSCLEVCALLFGGAAADYHCSTSGEAIDRQAFVDGWDDELSCETPVAEDFKLGASYDCGVAACSYSAYVEDHCDLDVVNHCWLACGDGDLDAGEACDDGNNADGDCCSATCQAEPAEQSCSDGDACNGDELCDGAGACADGADPDCDDGDLCSQDSCDAALGCQSAALPAPVCDDAAGKAVLALDAIRGKASFSWQKGSLDIAELGAPTEDTAYALCVYEAGNAPVAQLSVPGGGLCGGNDCWKAIGRPGQAAGFRFEDSTGASDGVRRIQLKAHAAGKAKLSLQARGKTTPPAVLGDGLSAPVTAQLVSSEGACWGAVFDADDVKRSDAERLKATRKNALE